MSKDNSGWRRATLIVPTAGLAAFFFLFSAQSMFAQGFPSQNIRIVVPFGPGGSPDVLGRLVAAKLAEKYGRPVVVENRPGANGLIAAELVKNAPPDGHTLFVGNTGILAINKSLYTRLPYDPAADFSPITQMISLPFFLYAHTQLGVRSINELIALLKSKPNALNYASSGNGSVHHMCSALFLNLTGAEAVHIPYKTSFEIATALMSDQVQFACSGKLTAQQVVDAGKALPLAVALEERSSLEAQVPTLKEETGLGGFEIGSRIGMLAPAHTPQPIIDQLSHDIISIVQTEQVRGMLAAQGVEIIAEGPDRYAALMRREIEQYAKLVRLTGAKIVN